MLFVTQLPIAVILTSSSPWANRFDAVTNYMMNRYEYGAVIYMQKVKSRVVKKNCNPEWNDELTLCVNDPDLPISVVSEIDI